MLHNVLCTIRAHRMLQPGDRVIVALSGGADSVALLHALHLLREELGLSLLAAAHFEHGLRGEASKADAAFCESLCGQLGLSLYSAEGHMRERPRPAGLGEESWARQLRYGFFERLAEEHGAKIATAHTLSDNAETVLFNSIRGSGPRGLAGIPPQRGPFIRPLLGCTGEALRRWCTAQGWAWREDATNADPAYASRNRLRHEVMPLLEKAHPGAERALARQAADMAALDGWLTAEARRLLAEAARGGGPWQAASWDASALMAAPAPLRLQALRLLAGRNADRAALARLEEVAAGQRRAAQLPGGIAFARAGGRLSRVEAPPPKDMAEWPATPGIYRFSGGFEVELQSAQSAAEAEQKKKNAKKGYTFLADCDKLIEYGCLRTRRAGDFFAPAGRGHTKPLRRWMQEHGVPAALRDALPLLARRGTGEVLWVWGAEAAAFARPKPGTQRVMLLTARRACTAGIEDKESGGNTEYE